MAKVSLNLPEEEVERIDRFVEDNPNYSNRSEFIRKAVKDEMDKAYEVLEKVKGSWSDEKAERARERLEKLREEDIEAQRAEM